MNAPSESGANIYSFDTGYARVIILDTNTAKDEAGMKLQKDFLEKKVKKAKEKGLWTIVGFHKPLYTGASHIVDNDLIALRKYFAPVFSELDVDLILQGHDHVYCRGFVTAGDPLTPNYSFLDKNSTDDGSDIKQEQTYTVFEVTNSEITAKTYNFKYDTDTDEITKDKYLYDSITLTRTVNTEDVSNIDDNNTKVDDNNKVSTSTVNKDNNANSKNKTNISSSSNAKKVKTADTVEMVMLLITCILGLAVVAVCKIRLRNKKIA